MQRLFDEVLESVRAGLRGYDELAFDFFMRQGDRLLHLLLQLLYLKYD